ncbi:MAG: M48 family metallopeptidase [Pseudobacteriovorax sp.]|nr:M48 family metallopeptidase [Pseudobacteriovorax sp.]
MVSFNCRGSYFDGISPVEQDVQVLFDTAGIVISGNSIPEGSLRIAALDCKFEFIGDDQCRITYSRKQSDFSSQISVIENDLSHKMSALGLTKPPLPTGSRRNKWIAGLISINIILFASAHFLMGPIAYWIANSVSHEREKELFHDWAIVSLIESKCNSSLHDKILDRLSAQILGEQYGDIHPEIMILDWDMVNAFALPGGQVIITKGFLNHIEKRQELVGVLAHELAHVSKRHVLAEYLKSLALVAFWSVTFGDYSGLIADPQTLQQFLELGFSRQAESEADLYAIEMLNDAGLDSTGIETFFESFQNRHEKSDENHEDYLEIPEILSTHPSHDNRIQMLKAISKVRENKGISLSDFRRLKRACDDNSSDVYQ